MIITIGLNSEGKIFIRVDSGNHMARWIRDNQDKYTDRKLDKDIYIDDKDKIEEFVKDCKANGKGDIEPRRDGLAGLYKDQVVISNPEQLSDIYSRLKDVAKTDVNNGMVVTTEQFAAAKAPPPEELKEFKKAYQQQYAGEFFKNVFSGMKRKMPEISSMEQVKEYAEKNPKSRTAEVLKKMRAKDQPEDEESKERKDTGPKR